MVKPAQRLYTMAYSHDSLAHTGRQRYTESYEDECLLWARDFQTLLNDDKGCDLFEKFLQEEKCDLTELNFVYACNGLRLDDEPLDDRDRDLRVRVIYRHYVKNGAVRAISDEVKASIQEKLDCKEIAADVFDDAVQEVKEHITKTTFAKFLQSDIYIRYVQRMTSGNKGTDDGSTDGSKDDHSETLAPLPSDSEEDSDEFGTTTLNNNNDSLIISQMPTVDEEDELENQTFRPPPTTMLRKPALSSMHVYDDTPPPLPPQSRTIQLQKRQSQRGLRYAENLKHGHKAPPNPYHVKSSAFVPPSAYNSELQSMSSGNYTDLESLDVEGTRSEPTRRHGQHDPDRRKQHRMNPSVVRGTMPLQVIPRTMFLLDPNCNLARDKPHEFYSILCRKLQIVLKEREIQEKMSKLSEDELHNQSILDNHVDRVFKSPTARTPRSPSPGTGQSKTLKAGHKSPYHLNPNFTRASNNNSNSRKDDNDSAIYMCTSSGMSTSTGVPLIKPRQRQAVAADSGCEESVLGAPSYNPHENVREWMNRPGHEAATSKAKNKASVCSGSNRSSKSDTDKKKKGSSSSKDEVVVGYQYEGETVPYVIRLPQRHLRLREFKAHLTKKGNFRYFFKRSMDGFGTQGVLEEVKDDNEILPLWEGKVFSQIVPSEPQSISKPSPNSPPADVM